MYLNETQKVEVERLSKFPTAPYSPQRPTGVLLSDEIEFYCKNYKLLDPYEPANIKAANYELRVGLNYFAGQKYELSRIGDKVVIPKFEVAVIEIFETINMPDFLIGRWNIRTRWAYKGLVWVGGPQVDAGFRGRLFCPIWNLSNQDFPIECGKEIAVIDFVTTTPPNRRSKHYPWNGRSRYVFDDYEKPRSGLITEAVDAIKKLDADVKQNRTDVEHTVEVNGSRVETLLEQSRNRIDNITAVMFTALGVLTAAIAVFATKASDPAHHYWWDPSLFWLCSIATVLALMAWVKARSEGKWWRKVEVFVLILATVAICLQVFFSWQQARRLNDSNAEIQQLRARCQGRSETRPVWRSKSRPVE